jgi:tripartite-type tricarboxylate transporter receptor subunit TctC
MATDGTRFADRRTFLKAAAGTGGILSLSGCTGAITGGGGEYPNEDIFWRIVGSEGGGTDSYARAYGQEASETLDVSFQYQAGFSTILPVVAEMYNAEPNGYNMMAMNLPSGPLAYLVNQPDWNMQDFVPICTYGLSPIAVFARKDLGVDNLGDLIAMYNEGELSKVGSQSMHTEVILNLLKNTEGYDWGWENLVRYGGGAPTMKAVTQGEIPVGLTSDSAVASGSAAAEYDIVPIAVLHSSGSAVLTDTPTVVDQDLPNIDFIAALQRAQWFPPETDTEKRDVIEDALNQAYESDAVKEWSEETGRRLMWMDHQETGDALEQILTEVPNKVDIASLRD